MSAVVDESGVCSKIAITGSKNDKLLSTMTDAMVEMTKSTPTRVSNISKVAIPPSPCQRNLTKIVDNEEKFDDVFDSDGECGPFFYCIHEDGTQLFNEDLN